MSALLTASAHPVIRRLNSGASGRTSTAPSRGCRAARCPIERRVKRGEFQDCESPQLLLGIRVGAILHAPLSFLESHRGPSLRHFKWIATDVDAGFDESLVVRPPRTDVGIGSSLFRVAKASGDS